MSHSSRSLGVTVRLIDGSSSVWRLASASEVQLGSERAGAQMAGEPKMSGWRGHQRAQHPREGTDSVRPDELSSVKVDDRNPPSTSQRVDL